MFRLGFYQGQNNWNHKFIPIGISEDESEIVIDLLIYKKHYVLNTKVNMF